MLFYSDRGIPFFLDDFLYDWVALSFYIIAGIIVFVK